MPDLLSIARKKPAEDEYSFESLRRSGIELVQQLSGSVWTDYNEHDPGVTILEQLCYALTDLTYRADFPVADFLTDGNGAIDWDLQRLLPPEQAFPCRPTTLVDYRAVLRDAVMEIENVQMDEVSKAEKGVSGLYKLELRLKPSEVPEAPSEREKQVKDRVRQKFAANRNLCEDLDSITVLPEMPFELLADVEIKEGFDPAEVLAQIYFATGMKVAAGIEFESFDRALSAGCLPEEIFRGPFTGYGRIANDKGPSLTTLPAPEVFAVIADVPGVESVAVTGPGAQTSAERRESLRLRFPKEGDDVGLRAMRGGRRVPVSVHEITMRYEELHFANRILTYAPEEIAQILPRPRGRVREITEYLSVQHHFPGIYAMGPHGVPRSAKPEVKARALQLKGYLLFFDQHMADYLAMLGNLGRLFSAARNGNETYFFQTLDDRSFPGIADVYPPYVAGRLRDLLKVYDNRDRTKRLLNYFLALYGESFPHDVLQKAEPNDPAGDDVLLARSELLREITVVTRDRAGAVDYTLPVFEYGNRSGLETKLGHLLRFGSAYGGSNERVRLIEHILLRPRVWCSLPRPTIPRDFYSFRLTVILPCWPRRCQQEENFKDFAEETVRVTCPAHIEASVLWLELKEMRQFDRLYNDWWNLQSEHGLNGAVEADAAAGCLLRFLLHKTRSRN